MMGLHPLNRKMLTYFSTIGNKRVGIGVRLAIGSRANVICILYPNELATTAILFPVCWCWAQRLGYILEFLGENNLVKSLNSYVEEYANNFLGVQMAHFMSAKNGENVGKWKSIVNSEADPCDYTPKYMNTVNS